LDKNIITFNNDLTSNSNNNTNTNTSPSKVINDDTSADSEDTESQDKILDKNKY